MSGEKEVFRISPIVGKCYEHIEATRNEWIEGKHGIRGEYRYFSTNQPTYVGKFLRLERYGSGDGGEVVAVFSNNGREVQVSYSYEGFTCFIEVPCRSGGGSKFRKSRKLNKKTKKTRRRR
jgi:hypothetical protein